MFCEKCGAKIEEGCKFCVACGTRVETVANTVETPVVNNVQFTAPTVTYAEGQQYNANGFDYANYNQEPQEPPKKKKMSKKWLKAIVAVALVVAILTGSFFAFKDYILFGFMRLMPAKTQFQYVYTRAATNLSEDIAVPLEGMRDLIIEDETIKGNVKLEIGDDAVTLLSLAGVDIGEFEAVSVNYNITKKDNLTKIALDIGDGNVKIVGAEINYDSERGKLTILVPELNADALEIDLEDYVELDKKQTSQMEEFYATVLPSPELIEKLLPKYIEIAFKQITNVTRKSDTLTAKGVSQSTTRFDAIIDEDTVKNMLLEMVKAVREDKDIKKYIITVFEAAIEMIDDDDFDDTPEDIYDDFIYQVDKVIDEVEDMELDFDGLEMTFTTHTNSKGDIVGIGFTVEKDDHKFVIEYANVESGGSAGIRGAVTVDDNDFAVIEGSGTKKGNKFTGSVNLIVQETEIVSLNFTDFDFDSYKEGYPKGSVEIELDSIVAKLVMGNRDFEKLAKSATASVKFDFDCSKKKTSVVMSLEVFGFDIGQLSYTQSSSKAEKIKMPDDTEDDIQEWTEDVDFDKIQENLEDVGLFDMFGNFLPSVESSKQHAVSGIR